MRRNSGKGRNSKKLGIWLSLLLTVSIAVLAVFRLAGVGESSPSYESSGTSQTLDLSASSGESESAGPSSGSSSAAISETSADWPEESGSAGESYPYPQYPYGYDRLDDAQRELYDLLESGTITPEQPYYFDPPIPNGESLIAMELVIAL